MNDDFKTQAAKYPLIKRPGREGETGFFPADGKIEERAQKLANHKLYFATFKAARNGKHHRKFFAILNGILDAVLEQTDDYTTTEELLTAVCIEIGHYDRVRLLNGSYFIARRSISFSKMDQVEFNNFYDRALQSLAKYLGVTPEELADAAVEFRSA
jgi:hypothetical protein